ncbi:MAG TPA: hypothetical protein VGL27_01775 [Negativicutes bacterium]|jgi:hypothetical protein
MEKIIMQVQDWPFLKTLSAELAGFSLATDLMQCGTQYRIFTYHKTDSYRSFSVLYDQATKEFLVRVVIGLTEYCDVNFITGSLQSLEQLLQARMEDVINGLAKFNKNTLDSIFIEKKVLEWPYGAQLPREIAGFVLYTAPTESVKFINGSYIIIDYCDFTMESNLIIYYNIYRDEFFGEIRIHRIPQMAAAFDAHTLPELEAKLNTHLEQTLKDMRLQLLQ